MTNKNHSDSNSLSLSKDYEIDVLRQEIERLRSENIQLQAALNDEDGKVKIIPNEEQICLEQISYLKSISTNRPLTSEETKRFDIFNKALIAIRGGTIEIGKKRKNQAISTEELLALVESGQE